MLRPKAQSIRAQAKQLFQEYCSNSSVHGVRYLSSRERAGCEKFWWLLVFIVSIGSCALLIQKTYRKWDQTPVIVSFDEKPTRVWQIPLPAVTVCPQTKTRFTWFNFSREHAESIDDIPDRNLTDNFLAMMQVCERIFYHLFFTNYILPNKTGSESYAALIENMSVPMYHIIDFCYFRGKFTRCTNLFQKAITEEGICFTFNGLSAKQLLRTEAILAEDLLMSDTSNSLDWTLDQGYPPHSNLSSYPYRTAVSGYSSGLAMNLVSNDSYYNHLCGGPIQGLKVLLHSPADYPQVSNKFIRVPINQEVTIAVKPQVITTSEVLRNYAPERRQCFFNHERYLKFFRVYTQDNCELECLTNFTLQYCGCVRFSMPRSSRTEVCESNMIECMILAENELFERDVVEHRKGEKNYRAGCNCLPSCTSVQYDAEITQTDFQWVSWMQALKVKVNESKGVHLSRLGIYYKEAQFIASKRSELFGLTDFLANCGGLLGLCMGVSLLSLVELVYFCSVRPLTQRRKLQEMAPSKGKEISAIGFDSISTGND
ncbi:pickpocket protein 28-like [Topomyia yanbarensis]|uniref:pickpocket protein 28-like n=1 Tax=Topomyia yanbarensis TaxID=2498891 RepID=UPI00273C5965|nr:pickpocket protein 28-like [Topomyia yanbarensis]